MPEIYEPVIIIKPDSVKMKEGSRIDSFVKIEGGEGVYIGKYVHIASFSHINIGGGTVHLGDYSAYASGAKVIGGSNLPDGQSMSAAAPREMQKVERSITKILDYAFVATNSIVMPGVTIGEGAVLAAGAVATRDIPPYEIWAGVPARRIADRLRG